MSYYAYTNLNHKDEYKVTAREVETGIIFANKYYCPCCSALFYFKSRSSNNKLVHFAKLLYKRQLWSCLIQYSIFQDSSKKVSMEPLLLIP